MDLQPLPPHVCKSDYDGDLCMIVLDPNADLEGLSLILTHPTDGDRTYKFRKETTWGDGQHANLYGTGEPVQRWTAACERDGWQMIGIAPTPSGAT